MPRTLTPAPERTELGVTSRGGAGRGITYSGSGTSTDIIVASVRAYIAAINRSIAHEERAGG